MADRVIIKSKTNKATKVALWLALILIFMMILIFFASSGEGDGVNLNKILGFLIMAASILFFVMRKKRNAPKGQYDIIKIVADGEYKQSGKTLNVLSANVERGGAGETYIHFIKDYVTYLYLEGVGVIETHFGKNIGVVKREKQTDEIAMAVAKNGIASQVNREKLINEGLYKDIVEE